MSGLQPAAVAVADDGGVFAVAAHPRRRRGGRGHRRHAAQAAGVRRLHGRRLLVTAGRTSVTGWRSGAAACWWRPARPSVRTCAEPSSARPLTDMVRFPRFLIARLWTPSTAIPTSATSSPGCGPTPRTTTWSRAPLPGDAGTDRGGGQPRRPRPRPQVRSRAAVGERVRRPVLVRVEARAATARASRPRSRPTRPPTSTLPALAARGWRRARGSRRRDPADHRFESVVDSLPSPCSTTSSPMPSALCVTRWARPARAPGVDVLLGDVTWETSYGLPGEGLPPRVQADLTLDWPTWAQTAGPGTSVSRSPTRPHRDRAGPAPAAPGRVAGPGVVLAALPE